MPDVARARFVEVALMPPNGPAITIPLAARLALVNHPAA